MKTVVASILILALAACQPSKTEPQSQAGPGGGPPAPGAIAAEAAPTGQGAPASAASQMPSPDTCDAKSFGWLLGENKSRVPAAPADKVIRVVCSTCAMTMDYSESRLNVIFLEKTGIVQKLTCG